MERSAHPPRRGPFVVMAVALVALTAVLAVAALLPG